jgi:hypothetical protein
VQEYAVVADGEQTGPRCSAVVLDGRDERGVVEASSIAVISSQISQRGRSTSARARQARNRERSSWPAT